MMTREGFKSFLRDVSVNIVGVLIAAAISFTFAFWVYDYRNQNQCNGIMEMILEENRLNEQTINHILGFLSPIVDSKSKDTLSLKTFHNRLRSNAVIMASQSELVARYVPSSLRFDIVVHSENLQNLNTSINGFNYYLDSHKDCSKISFRYTKEWASTIIEQVNSRIDDSRKLSGKISKYLNEYKGATH
jgi:hypothetical protein